VLRTRRRAEREASEARRLERDARHSEEIALMEAALAGDEPGASRLGDGSGSSAEADDDDEEALLGTRERAAAEAAAEADADAADYDDLDEQDRARAAILADQAGQQSDQRATRQRDPEY
jgi:CPA2 family monovalent cation:H+ antiporter-2